MIPNPMLILAVVLAFIANGFYWHANGVNGENTRWKAKTYQELAAASEAARKQQTMWQGVVNETVKNKVLFTPTDLFRLILPFCQIFLDPKINRSQAKNLKCIVPPKAIFQVRKAQTLLNDVYHGVNNKNQPKSTSCLI